MTVIRKVILHQAPVFVPFPFGGHLRSLPGRVSPQLLHIYLIYISEKRHILNDTCHAPIVLVVYFPWSTQLSFA
jgi:hypothetical protein